MILRRERKRFVPVCVALFLAAALMLPVSAGAAGRAEPRGLTVGAPSSSAGGCLLLEWTVEDASSVRAYRVYRSESPDSGFRPVHTEPVSMSGGGRMDHVDTGLEGGRTYYYRVSLVGEDGRKTGRSAVASGSPQGPSRSRAGGLAGKRIIISIADQRIYFLENEVLVRSHLCSTGTYSHPTPEGVFKIEYHQYLLVSERYGGAYCYWWMGFAPDCGMHALPYNPKTKTWTGANKLGQRASHGCVRQAVADAEWAYRWAPDGTRLDIIPQHYEPPAPKPTRDPITGGHGSQGITGLSRTWYFAEGCTSGGFDEYILVMNPNPGPAAVDVDFMKPDGKVTRRSYSVPGFSRYTVNVDAVEGLGDTELSAALTSDRPVSAERSMYFDYNGRLGGTNTVGVPRPSLTWFLAEGYTGGEFDEFVLIQNPGEDDALVTATYMTPDGLNVVREYTVGAQSRFSVHVDDVPELSATEVSAWLTSDQPVVVERAQYFDYYGRDDGTASTGVTAPAVTWYLAEGYTGGDFDTYVLIQNPSAEKARALVTFMRSDGKNITGKLRLQPRSRYTVKVDDVPGLESAEVSTLVESDVPVIVERAMYYVSYGRPGGSDAPGVTGPQTYWYLAEGYTGGEFDTYILILNPHDEEVYVDINYLLPGGVIKRDGYTVGPRSRYTVHVDAVEGMTDTEFSTALTGDRPVVCERAMYFSIPRD